MKHSWEPEPDIESKELTEDWSESRSYLAVPDLGLADRKGPPNPGSRPRARAVETVHFPEKHPADERTAQRRLASAVSSITRITRWRLVEFNGSGLKAGLGAVLNVLRSQRRRIF